MVEKQWRRQRHRLRNPKGVCLYAKRRPLAHSHWQPCSPSKVVSPIAEPVGDHCSRSIYQDKGGTVEYRRPEVRIGLDGGTCRADCV